MDRKHTQRLDPRKPLVLDTRELGRRPGSMRELHTVVPAPAGLGIADLVGVPVGGDLDLDLRLESVMEGVLVSGEVTATVTGECSRCLEPVSEVLSVQLQELYAYEGKGSEASSRGGDADDEEESRMEGDHLDLEPALRDAVVLALPLTPLCSEDCSGLCVDCGERLDDLPEDHTHEATDPRWAALRGLSDRPAPSDPGALPDARALSSKTTEEN